jgi:hypothetical protein
MFLIQTRQQRTFTWREWRDFFANVLQEFVVIGPRSQRVELASPLLQLRVKDVPITLENVDKLRLDFRKHVNPFDVRCE